MNAARIFANLRDGRDVMSGVEPLRISVVMRENLP
jgi:LacI family transcriptional regulator